MKYLRVLMAVFIPQYFTSVQPIPVMNEGDSNDNVIEGTFNDTNIS